VLKSHPKFTRPAVIPYPRRLSPEQIDVSPLGRQQATVDAHHGTMRVKDQMNSQVAHSAITSATAPPSALNSEAPQTHAAPVVSARPAPPSLPPKPSLAVIKAAIPGLPKEVQDRATWKRFARMTLSSPFEMGSQEQPDEMAPASIASAVASPSTGTLLSPVMEKDSKPHGRQRASTLKVSPAQDRSPTMPHLTFRRELTLRSPVVTGVGLPQRPGIVALPPKRSGRRTVTVLDADLRLEIQTLQVLAPALHEIYVGLISWLANVVTGNGDSISEQVSRGAQIVQGAAEAGLASGSDRWQSATCGRRR